MKLNWFSPLPPMKSGIADYVWHVLPALSRSSEITLWSNQPEWDKRLERYARVRRATMEPRLWRQLNRADMTIYHIGNNANFHGEIWDISRHHPGVVILHDLVLQHFFSEILITYQQSPEGYLDLMERYYGSRGRQAGERLLAGRCTREHLAERYPLTLHALENAVGVMVHTQDNLAALRNIARWPVALAALPFCPRYGKPVKAAAKKKRVRRNSRRLIVFGHLWPNRRLKPLFTALSEVEEKERYRLDIYGRVWDIGYLNRACESLGLTDIVHFHGFVSETRLREGLAGADLAINLRYPTMGEASLSQLLIWEFSLPTLVTKSGWYSQLPEDVVAFVHMEREVEDIKGHLQGLFSDTARLAEMGRRGRLLLGQEHKPELYVDRVLELASEGARFRCRAPLFRFADSAAMELDCLRGLTGREKVAERVAGSFLSFFDRGEDRG